MTGDRLVESAGLKVAVVHHWLVRLRGAERVLEHLCRMFPQADLYTLVADRTRLSPSIAGRQIRTSFLQCLPGAKRWYGALLPLMPMAFEQFDLSGYDLVLSSDASLAKGVLTGPDTLHICYCYSPPRYLWNMYHLYVRDECRSPFKRLAFRAFSNYLRLFDFCAAQRVDHFLCISRTVQARIRKYYRREAAVIHPPVDLDRFQVSELRGDGYLVVSHLAPYKKVDLAVRAFTLLGRRLVVVGEGPEAKRLRRIAGRNVEFVGHVPDEDLPGYYAACRALVFPGEEDLGLAILEAQASGRPVIAYGKGGATETVVPGETGLLFDSPTPEGLAEAVLRFEAEGERYDPSRIRAHAEGFSPERFRQRFLEAVRGWLARKGGASGLP